MCSKAPVADHDHSLSEIQVIRRGRRTELQNCPHVPWAGEGAAGRPYEADPMLRHRVLGTMLMMKGNVAPSGAAPDWSAIVEHAKGEVLRITAALGTYEIEVEAVRQLDRQIHMVEELDEAWKTTRPRSRLSSKKDIGLGDLAEAWVAGLRPDVPSDATPKQWTALVRVRIEDAGKDFAAFEALCLHSSRLIAEGLSLPQPLRQFAAGVLTGERRRPDLSAASARVKVRNDLFVALITNLCHEYELNPTRNDETSDQVSACDILADAMTELGLKPESYSAWKKIWAGRSGGRLRPKSRRKA